jgi:hypothetical protein
MPIENQLLNDHKGSTATEKLWDLFAVLDGSGSDSFWNQAVLERLALPTVSRGSLAD